MKKFEEEKEIWKPVDIEVDCINKTRYEVSNFGRVRSFNKVSNGKILKGSMTEGYRIIRLKLHRARSEMVQDEVEARKEEISGLYEHRRYLKRKKASKLNIDRTGTRIEKREKKLHLLLKKDLKKRTMNHHFLIHRLVAKYFLPSPDPEESILAHLDYNKLNNRVENLKWMTPEEHQKHIRKSPYVIAEKKERKYTQKLRTRKEGWKLNSTEVMHIKKLLKRGWTLRRIAKQFKVSDMQIHRIKTGENWGHVKIPE